MFDIFSLLSSTEVTAVNSAFKLLLSLLLGAMVGLERRHKGQIAGMRTFALISLGATLAMLVSIYIPQEYLGLKNGDPGRIAAQVISGIGFLGAGAIIQMKGSVRGLTTAAGIWSTAAIGLAVGAGMYVVGTLAALLIILVLKFLEWCEHRLLRGAEQKIVRLKASAIVTDPVPYRTCLARHGVHISEEYLRYDYTNSTTIINFMVRARDNTDFIALFASLNALGGILSLTLTNEVNN